MPVLQERGNLSEWKKCATKIFTNFRHRSRARFFRLRGRGRFETSAKHSCCSADFQIRRFPIISASRRLGSRRHSRFGNLRYLVLQRSRFVKTISPGPTLRSSRDKWGMGVRHALFPEPALGAFLSEAAGFPTPFSTASGVIGLVAGPSSALRRLNFE